MTREEQEIPSLIPKPIQNVEIRGLPIGPIEAFVLSRVDGRASPSDISLATGINRAEVETLLHRLAQLGAVAYGEEPISSRTTTPERATVSAEDSGSGTRQRVTPIDVRLRGGAEDGDGASDAAEHPDGCDIDVERRQAISTLFRRLDRITHYELLEVPRTATKKEIKAAYYRSVATFHPDKYFGRTLGQFKPKLERIFTRLTEAHDTLTRPDRREDYDRYLESQTATRSLDGSHDDVEAIRREIEREASQIRQSSPGHSPSVPPPMSPVNAKAAPSIAARESLSSAPEVEIKVRPPATPEERRRALARKLGASIPPPGANPSGTARPSAPPPAPAINAHEAAAEALKRRYEARVAQARDERVTRYVQQAEQSIAEKNFVAAATALRIATSLAPDDTALAARYEAADIKASAAFAEQYLEQARYDERRGHHLEAAQAYERVLRGRPTAQIYDRAAFCHLEAAGNQKGDLKRAVDLAKKAVELSPKETAYRITLARVYARAGMEQSAVGELERARLIDPSDDTVKDWIKRFKRGET